MLKRLLAPLWNVTTWNCTGLLIDPLWISRRLIPPAQKGCQFTLAVEEAIIGVGGNCEDEERIKRIR